MTWQPEVEQLLAQLECGTLDEAGRTRLNELMRANDDVCEFVGSSLEVEAMLRWHHGSIEAKPARVFRPRWPIFAALAAGVLAFVVLQDFDGGQEEPVVEHLASLDPSWRIDAGDARYQIREPGRVWLESGELFVASTVEPAAELVIETAGGEAKALGTSFYVGSHSREEGEREMMLTRVLVLTGAVALTNGQGSVTAEPGEMAFAQAGSEPTKLVARANNGFALDLYRRLGSEQEGSLFMSPYSLAVALTMVLEGARGETAEELAEALHLPQAARRLGGRSQQLPFLIGQMHTGHQDLARKFESAVNDPEQRAMRRELEKLRARSAQLSESIRKFYDERDYRGARPFLDERGTVDERIGELEAKEKSYRLSIANALWGERSYPFDGDYLRTIRNAYGTGALVEADFVNRPDFERRRMNDWVASQTRGRITQLVPPEGVTVWTRLALLNAIDFQADWLEPFSVEMTRADDFVLADGSKANTEIMSVSLEESRYGAFEADGSPFASPEMMDRGQTVGLYPDDGGFQILEMPYRGEDLSMVVFLPMRHDRLPQLEAKLTSENLERWLGQLEAREVWCRLPKFEMQSEFALKETLTALGAGRAFVDPRVEGGADFTGITSSRNPEEWGRIADVFHKAAVRVTEKGTEAAAASAIMWGPVGAAAPDRMPFVPRFHAVHSFAYLIRDVNTGAILFMGRLTRP